jgi:Ser-Thr-rich glycosyl-phosphatidyl-inositol-anchored membrane family
MKKAALIFVCIIGCIGIHSKSFSQNLVMNLVEVKDNQIVIHYDLNDLETHHTYSVSLFTSQNNFTTKMLKVSGDAGYEVAVGKDKQLIWDISGELGPYKGRLTFDVRAHLYVPFAKIKGIDEGRVFRRGKSYPIVWTSGDPEGKVNIELYKGSKLVLASTDQKNSGLYQLLLPVSTPVGKDYKLKFINPADVNEAKFSQPFTVKRKVPTGVKVAVLAVVAGGAIILTGGKSSTPPPVTQPVDHTLPDAPGPP